MKLIADSGSTKTEWILLDKENSIINTIGLNPLFIDENDITNTVFKTELIKFNTKITELLFFGAGCGTKERKEIIYNGLSLNFPCAKIIVESDLLGAGIAMFGKNEGIIGILGTGSNTGYYNNCEIKKNISSLGYILGDEGSGAHIGKIFIKAFLNNELPKNINDNFKTEFQLDLSEIINNVYKQPFPNRFLASFMPFIYNNKSENFIQELLAFCFDDFFKKTIIKYENYQNKEIKLIGSVAYYFADEIKLSAQKFNVIINKIDKTPTKGLIDFYK